LTTSQALDFAVLREPDPVLVARARVIGQSSIASSVLLSLFSPAHWWFGFSLTGLAFATYTPSHAVGSLMSVGISLSLIALYLGRGSGIVKPIWYLITIAMGIILFEYVTPTELPFAQYIRFLDPVENRDKIPPNGALCLGLASVAAILFCKGTDRAIRIAQTMAITICLIALLAIIGHGYAVESLYGVSDYSAMTLPGSLHYLSLGIALLCVKPDKGLLRIVVMPTAAGVMSRRLYTAVIVLPPILGFFALISSELWKWYNIPFAVSLLVLASMLLIAAVIALTSVRLERTDTLRVRAEQDLHASRERLRDLSAHIQVLQEEERVRIAREVHDELGQSLTALKMDVSMLTKQLPQTNEVERRTRSIMDLVNGTIRSVQRISAELRPSLLDDLGLAAALEWQAREFERRSGIDITLDLPGEDIVLSKDRSTAIFRIFQETLTNVARHSGASHVEVSLTRRDSEIVFTVHDDGIGLHEQTLTNRESLGVMGMRERASLVGGTLEITGYSGDGATVTVVMPIERSTDNATPIDDDIKTSPITFQHTEQA